MAQPSGIPRSLEEVRRSKALTQKVLASCSGLSANTIVSLEAGRHRPSPATLGQLARALGMTSEDVWCACEESCRRAAADEAGVQP